MLSADLRDPAGQGETVSFPPGSEIQVFPRAAYRDAFPRHAAPVVTTCCGMGARRYHEVSVAVPADGDTTEELAVIPEDKLGDSSTVGQCIPCYEHKTANIDTLLVSCRALGRGQRHTNKAYPYAGQELCLLHDGRLLR